MSAEALWKVSFGHAGGGEHYPVNGGVVVVETGRVFGGDSFFAYVGTVTFAQKSMTGTAKITRHHDDPDSIDAWGTGDDEFEISFRLKFADDYSEAIGVMDRGGHEIGMRLQRLAELP